MRTCGYIWSTDAEDFPEDATVFATRERARDVGLKVYEGVVYTGIMLRVEPTDLVPLYPFEESGMFTDEFNEGLELEVCGMLENMEDEITRTIKNLLIGMLTKPCAELKSYEVREIEKHDQVADEGAL